MPELVAILVSISTWAAPQPVHSYGDIYNYGGQSVIEATAAFRGYTLDGYLGGISAISPAHLGQVAWVRVGNSGWVGPLTVVDAVARSDAYGSIYERQEIAEVPRWLAHRLGFEYGAAGELYLGLCPPVYEWSVPAPYAPPLVVDHPPYEPHRSWYPYPPQQRPVTECGREMMQ